jgi:hypothetical protein
VLGPWSVPGREMASWLRQQWETAVFVILLLANLRWWSPSNLCVWGLPLLAIHTNCVILVAMYTLLLVYTMNMYNVPVDTELRRWGFTPCLKICCTLSLCQISDLPPPSLPKALVHYISVDTHTSTGLEEFYSMCINICARAITNDAISPI